MDLPPPANSNAPISRSPITLADLTGDLLWPQIFHAARLAMSPGRLLIAFAVVVIVFSIDSAAQKLGVTAEGATAGPAQSLLVAIQEQIANYFTSVFRAAASTPLKPWTYSPEPPKTVHWTYVFLALPAFLVFAIGGTAICRSVACDYAARVKLRWTESLGFAVGRAASVVFAQLAPLVLVAVIVGVLWVGGFILQWPVVNILGGVLYGLGVVLGFVAAFVLTVYIFGQMLLAPAVAANAADGFGAIERAYAYVLGRPGRLLLYVLLAAGQGVIALVVASAITIGAGSIVSQITRAPSPESLVDAAWHVKTAARLVSIWNAAIGALLVAYFVSFYYSASTIIYLLLRRLIDGQDVAEVWMPGLIDSTLAKATDRTADPIRN